MNPVTHRLYTSFARLALGLVVLCSALPGWAQPEGGWWWNPGESGRGFFIEIQGPRMFLAGYFYESDGRATWLVSNDPMPAEMSYSGRLLAFANGQSLVGDYRPPGAAVDAGAVSLQFSDETHGVLTWPGGTVAIERYHFSHGDDSDTAPMTGWWWNPAESGRGFSVELQGDHMFIGAYMYDADGNPLWYVADALMQSENVFNGPLLQFSNGQTMSDTYHAPSPSRVAGSLMVQFTDDDHATVTLSDTDATAAPLSKTVHPKQFVVERQRIDIPRVERPAIFGGIFSQVMTFPQNGNALSIEVKATEVRWQQSVDLASLNGGTLYEPESGKVSATMTGTLHYQDGGTCTINGQGTHDLAARDGHIDIKSDGFFVGFLAFPLSLSGSCEFSMPIVVNISLRGLYKRDMSGNPQAPSQATATRSSYLFVPCPYGLCPVVP